MLEPLPEEAPHSSQPTRLDTPKTDSSESAPSRRVSLRLNVTSEAATSALLDANDHLSAQRPKAALEIYTEVLTTSSPGHPCAFLNRALCYILLGFPELAVVDAQRALIGVTHAKLLGQSGSLQAKQIVRFGSRTEEERLKGRRWTKPPDRLLKYKDFEWLEVELGSIDVVSRSKTRHPRASSPNLVHDVLMKAYYRIAFALWKCGGGALRSALEVLRLAHGAGWDEDAEQFNALGNRILLDVEKVLKKEDRVTRQLVQTGRLEANARSRERWELQGVRGLLRTRYTSIKKERYPWDEHESTTAVPGSMEALNESQSYMTENCEIKAVSQEMGKTVRYFMVAKEDIYPGDVLVEEKSPFHVTTSPEGHEDSFPCDACAACLEVPKCILERTYSNTPSIPDSDEVTQGSSSRDDLGISDGDVAEYIRTPPGQKDYVTSSIETETDRDIALSANKNLPPPGPRQEPQSRGPTPPPHVVPVVPIPAPATPPTSTSPRHTASPPSHEGFQICYICRITPYCSRNCCNAAMMWHHSAVCGRECEDQMRYGYLQHSYPEVPEPSLQVLEGLMLLRFLACARVDESNPLGLSSMRLLDGELGPARHIPNDKSMEEDVAMTDCHGYDDLNCLTAQNEGQSVENDDQRIPWSYFSNVVRPLSCLLDMGRVEGALDIKNYDGWILNTMIAKIHANLRCTTQPRWHKKYDEDGQLIGCRPIPRQVTPKSPCSGTPEDRGIRSDVARLEGVW
ncbi:hypothetical protein LTR04_007143, partial [Oleoguttula sp. CCFEE 6159]